MNIYDDIMQMHTKFGVYDWIEQNKDNPKMNELYKLRLRMLTEEYAETMNAYLQGDSEEVVDGLIDIIVIAVGTLDILGVNPAVAWDEVHGANMAKQVGVKPGRPNTLGLPDLVKPSGWTAPSHANNVGLLPTLHGSSVSGE